MNYHLNHVTSFYLIYIYTIIYIHSIIVGHPGKSDSENIVCLMLSVRLWIEKKSEIRGAEEM